MKLKENDAYAFPMPASEFAGHGPDGGMSLRDYFAGKAIAGLSSGMGDMCVEDIERAIPIAASISYAIADAMLLERAK